MEEIINIDKERIISNFTLDEQNYCVLSNNNEDTEDSTIYFAKIDYLDDNSMILRNIELDDEYEMVSRYFDGMLSLIGDEE